MIGICGGVGSGKSSLLYGCLGQMNLIKGTIKVGGSYAYVGQQAWIVNGSIKENILMGEEADSKL